MIKRLNFNKHTHKQLQYFRDFDNEDFESQEENGFKIRGYAVVYDRLSGLGLCGQCGTATLFKPNSLQLPNYNVNLYYNHDPAHILATEGNGLIFKQDDKGVYFEADISDDTYIDQFVREKIKGGKIKGMSFGAWIEGETEQVEQMFISEEHVKDNQELADFLGQTIDVQVVNGFILDELTITAIPHFPQASLEQFTKDKGNQTSIKEIDNYLIELQLMELDSD